MELELGGDPRHVLQLSLSQSNFDECGYARGSIDAYIRYAYRMHASVGSLSFRLRIPRRKWRIVPIDIHSIPYDIPQIRNAKGSPSRFFCGLS